MIFNNLCGNLNYLTCQKRPKNLCNCRNLSAIHHLTFASGKTKNMTRFNTSFTTCPTQTQKLPTVWVKALLEGEDQYRLSILEKTGSAQKARTPPATGCAYARLSLMESGAIMATFPLMGMVSGAIRQLLGTTSFDLAEPFQIPASCFGVGIDIPAGKHPLVFVLENWVVLFRPEITIRL